jgi:hypothetical protein
MWWLIQNIIFSICLIVIIHYLYLYFEATLTSPKVKDLIHCPKQEYKLLLESINKNVDGNMHIPQMTQQILEPSIVPAQTSETLGINNTNNNTNYNTNNPDDMKMDLKEYIRELALKTNVSNQIRA